MRYSTVTKNGVYLQNKEYETKKDFKNDVIANDMQCGYICNPLDVIVRVEGDFLNLKDYLNSNSTFLHGMLVKRIKEELAYICSNYKHYSYKDINYYNSTLKQLHSIS